MSKLPPPHPEDLSNLQEWMRHPSMGGVFLIGSDRNVWAEGKDLIAVRANNQTTRSSGYWLMPSRQCIITLLESTITLVKILCAEIREQRPTVV
jgi:hypothetical protein